MNHEKPELNETPEVGTIRKGLRYLKARGLRTTMIKIRSKLCPPRADEPDPQQDNVVFKPKPRSARELRKERRTVFDVQVRISILVPLYNTPQQFLIEMIQSVRNQTYGNWELCLADGSDAEHTYVQELCESVSAEDARIRYQKLEQNLGISENTNRCIDMSKGEYIGLLDHDDVLDPSALYEVMKVISENSADFIYTDENTFSETLSDAYCPHFKADFAPDTLRSYNYICHFSVFSRTLMEKVGDFRSQFDGSQDYDLILRLTEQAQNIVHIPQILYYWRAHAESVALDLSAKTYTLDAAKKALAEHLLRIGLAGKVLDSSIPSTYKIAYQLQDTPLITILIPNKDHTDMLDQCIRSVREKSTYSNYEIIIIENNSTEAETFAYYETLAQAENIRVVYWEGVFNYSAINNYGCSFAKGEYILLLNNDIEVISPDWMQEMLMFAQRKDVGAVGAKLLYPDDTIQHAGVILGVGGVAGHSHKYYPADSYGYMSRLTIAQNLSAVTAACMMMRKSLFEELEGLDETFEVAFNDVDLCMRIRQAGYLIIFTPYAQLYHYESKSRGVEDTPEKQKRFEKEVLCFQSRWGKELQQGDPYYNPNLTLQREDFSFAEQ